MGRPGWRDAHRRLRSAHARPRHDPTVRLPRAARAALAAVLGLVALAAGGAVFLAHAILTGVRPVDVLGILLIPVGVALLAVAATTALRGRRRWVQIVAVVVASPWWRSGGCCRSSAPAWRRTRRARGRERRDARAAGRPRRDVRGVRRVRLAGWYVPGRDGTAVVLAHGSHDDRSDTLVHLRLLARPASACSPTTPAATARARAPRTRSGGRAWDVAGAAAFLRRQPGVERVAMLGLSMGAEEALRAAAGGVPFAAVVADGAGASTSGDQRLVEGGPLPASVTWLTMRGVELLGGGDEPAALADVAGRIDAPVLLIASGRSTSARSTPGCASGSARGPCCGPCPTRATRRPSSATPPPTPRGCSASCERDCWRAVGDDRRMGLELAIAFAIAFAVTNGFHDAANAIATLVATRGARPGQAVVVLGRLQHGRRAARRHRGGRHDRRDRRRLAGRRGRGDRLGRAGGGGVERRTWWLGLPSSSGTPSSAGSSALRSSRAATAPCTGAGWTVGARSASSAS